MHFGWKSRKKKHTTGMYVSILNFWATAPGLQTRLHLPFLLPAMYRRKIWIRRRSAGSGRLNCVRKPSQRVIYGVMCFWAKLHGANSNTFVIVKSMEMENRELLNTHNGIPAP